MSTPEELVAKIELLTPPDKLRLAADLLDECKFDLAYAIVERLQRELGAALAMMKVQKREKPR
ncbi:MAG: hypothetical protein V1755_05705 [Chloroflexota bacterium]